MVDGIGLGRSLVDWFVGSIVRVNTPSKVHPVNRQTRHMIPQYRVDGNTESPIHPDHGLSDVK